MQIPKYAKSDILRCIKKEGLCSGSWGYKGSNCIWVFTEAMEKERVWKNYPTPLKGFERAMWNRNCIEPVKYFLLSEYTGNMRRLSFKVNNPDDEGTVVPDD